VRARVNVGSLEGLGWDVRVVGDQIAERFPVLDAPENGVDGHSRAADHGRAAFDGVLDLDVTVTPFCVALSSLDGVPDEPPNIKGDSGQKFDLR
jgi:hypothetical protein